MPSVLERIVDPDNGAGTHYTALDTYEDNYGGVGGNGDCVGQDVIARALCRCTGGTADTALFTFGGWTSTDADHYIEVITDSGYGHVGVEPTGNIYRLETTGSCSCVTNYVRFRRIAVILTPASNTRRGLIIQSCTDIAVTDSLFIEKTSAYTGGAGVGFWSAAAQNTYVVNCVFWGFNAACIKDDAPSGTGVVYYNTMADSARGIQGGAGRSITAKNNIIFNTTIGALIGTYTVDTANNGTKTGDNDPGDIDLGSDGTAIFLDYAGQNYHLCEGSAAADLGADLSEDALYPVSDDYCGTERTDPDLGFYELPATVESSAPLGSIREGFLDRVSRWSLRVPIPGRLPQSGYRVRP